MHKVNHIHDWKSSQYGGHYKRIELEEVATGKTLHCDVADSNRNYLNGNWSAVFDKYRPGKKILLDKCVTTTKNNKRIVTADSKPEIVAVDTAERVDTQIDLYRQSLKNNRDLPPPVAGNDLFDWN